MARELRMISFRLSDTTPTMVPASVNSGPPPKPGFGAVEMTPRSSMYSQYASNSPSCVTRPPARARRHRRRREDGCAERHGLGRRQARRGQALALHAQESQPHVEVLGDDLCLLDAPALEHDLAGPPPHDHVVE